MYILECCLYLLQNKCTITIYVGKICTEKIFTKKKTNKKTSIKMIFHTSNLSRGIIRTLPNTSRLISIPRRTVSYVADRMFQNFYVSCNYCNCVMFSNNWTRVRAIGNSTNGQRFCSKRTLSKNG